MKKLFFFSRIAAILFNGYLFFGLGFDYFSCIVSVLIVFAITTQPKQKKSEARTSDL